MMSKRGLIISPPIVASAGGLLVKSGALDPQELRTSLLFWDLLDFPSGAIHIDGGEDARFLETEGHIVRTYVPTTSFASMGHHFRRMMLETFAAHEQSEPGVWSIHTGSGGASFEDDQLEEGRGVLVALNRALPVPNFDVPLADLLKFREHRKDELLALRHHIETIYTRIVSSGDGPLTRASEIEALDRSISNYMASAKETGLSFRRMSLDAELNVLGFAASGAAALALGTSLATAALSAAAGSISLNVGHSLRGLGKRASPFRYVSSYHKELF